MDPGADASDDIVAVSDAEQAVVTITYGQDPTAAQAILASLTVDPNYIAPAAASQRLGTSVTARLGSVQDAAMGLGSNGVFQGLGFDACSAPSLGGMQAWYNNSPYRAVGIYIGGPNRACGDGNLSASWVQAVQHMGWSLIPIYVGLQAPCSGVGATINSSNAYNEGVADANDAANRAQHFGLATGSPIFDDMEYYPSCGGPVFNFVRGWNAQLSARHFTSAIYINASKVSDLFGGAEPNTIWIAAYDGVATTSSPYIPSYKWANNQRLKQYTGGHNETFGGYTYNIDRNDCDYYPHTATAPPPPPPPTTSTAARASNPSVTSSAPGQLNVFTRTPANTLGYRSFAQSTGWSQWQDLGGNLLGNPAVVSWAPGREDIFVRGPNNQLWHDWSEAGRWGTWEDLGGSLAGDPTAVALGADNLAIFARFTDGSINEITWTGKWSGWQNRGITSLGDPTAVTWASNRIDLFIRGTNQALWHTYYSSGVWHSGWESLGGIISSDPIAVAQTVNRLDVFARAGNNELFSKSWTGTSWTGWGDLHGSVAGNPSVVSWSNGRLDIFTRDAGTTHNLDHIWSSNGNWGTWQSLGGSLGTDPVAVSWSAYRLDVFAKGTNPELFHQWWSGSAWAANWEDLHGAMYG